MTKKITLLYIVLDGAADGIKDDTSLALANTPNMDEVSKLSIGGMHYPVGVGVAPESDTAVLNLLGYDHNKYHVGRGVLEALGVGLTLDREHEVAFRGNLATADFSKGLIIDRRVGRKISTREAKALIRDLQYVTLDIYDGYAKVRVGLDYRVVVVIGSKTHKLSSHVSNTDPAYIRIGDVSVANPKPSNEILECKPLSNDRDSVITAELVNTFLKIANEHLSKHPLNNLRIRKGLLPANTILLRDGSMMPRNIPRFRTMYGLRLGLLADMPTEIGIARLLGIRVIKCPKLKYQGEVDYPVRAERVLKFLAEEKYDVIYVHLKGPDIYGHDGDKEGKIKSIEEIDRYFISKILDNVDFDNTAILITMDHPTPPEARTHTGDPVPFIIFSPNLLRRDGFQRFSER